jgi:hypothetical protein
VRRDSVLFIKSSETHNAQQIKTRNKSVIFETFFDTLSCFHADFFFAIAFLYSTEIEQFKVLFV